MHYSAFDGCPAEKSPRALIRFPLIGYNDGMRASELREMLKAEPFRPIKLGLSDGRAVTIRHPDQVLVTDRTIFVGVARIERSKPMLSPASGDRIAKQWVLVNLLHIIAVEPQDENGSKSPKRRRKT